MIGMYITIYTYIIDIETNYNKLSRYSGYLDILHLIVIQKFSRHSCLDITYQIEEISTLEESMGRIIFKEESLKVTLIAGLNNLINPD